MTLQPAFPSTALPGIPWPNFPGATIADQTPAIAAGNAWMEYLIDAFQRSVLFLDILRQRGDQQAEMAARPMATVLRFQHQQLMSGHALPHPMNYFLSRIIPPKGVKIDQRKRPIVVVDPRAGQGPGIGGFKKESEIGDALAAGHPVYFIGFTADPVPGQRFLDVVEGQVKFFEEVVKRHPEAPKPMAIGNCQAGYQTLMVAMLRPDLFGLCLVTGSPMSYWQGVHGKNPMRYSGGLLGGSWLTALTSDLGAGIFDGAWLIENFDGLNPANWLWTKQYQVYENVDTDGPRYLEFEKWWGDFIVMNGDEIQYLVDELFIGGKLTRNEIASSTGQIFDLRNITSPIICFTSFGDNISPPQQTLGWIVDLYRDVEDIRARGRTIVYCLDEKAGHLALFVSSRVGANEDAEFVKLMDVIDCLPPGLFEMVIKPRQNGEAKLTPENSIVTFEPRTLDDIRALGRNSAGDDRAFAAVDQISQLAHNFYEAFYRPYVQAMANPGAAAFARAMHPLRLSYTMFTSRNPLMQQAAKLAEEARNARKPVPPSNPYWQMQEAASKQIEGMLKAYGDARDAMAEHTFWAVFGTPAVQNALRMNETWKPARSLPPVTPEQAAAREKRKGEYAAKLNTGTYDDALLRAVLFVVGAIGAMDSRTGIALDKARQSLMHLPEADFKAAVRTQSDILEQSGDRAVQALPNLVPSESKRRELVRTLRSIVLAGGISNGLEAASLSEVARMLGLVDAAPSATAGAGAPRDEAVHAAE